MAKKGKGFLGAIGSFFGSIPVVKKVVKTGKRMWKGIKKKGKQLFKFFKKFMKKLGKLYTKARKKARKLKKWAIRWGKRTWKAGVLWLKNTAQKGARWVKQKSKQVYQKTKQVYQQTKQQIKQVYQQTKQAVNVVKTAAKEVVKTYKAIGKGQLDAKLDLVKDLCGEVKKFAAHPIGYVNDSIAGTVEGVANLALHPVKTITAIKDSVKDSFEKDVINGDAYSRSYWLTDTTHNIAKEFIGKKGAGLIPIPNSTDGIITKLPRPNLSKDPQKPEETKGTGKYTGGRTQKELDDLAGDPSHGGKIRDQGLKEREIGLDLEQQGKLGKIIRDPQGNGGAEFIDTTNNTKWDVKSFVSYPNGHTSPKKGAFTVSNGMKGINKELEKNYNVIVDVRDMVPEHVEQLKEAIEKAGVSNRIIWYP